MAKVSILCLLMAKVSTLCLLIAEVSVCMSISHGGFFTDEGHPTRMTVLALASGRGITIVTMDELKESRIRKIPLYETPKKIAYQEETETFAVLSTRTHLIDSNGAIMRDCCESLNPTTSSGETTTSLENPTIINMKPEKEHKTENILIISQNTFEVCHHHMLHHTERALSICSTKLKGDDTVYYVVGTGLINQTYSTGGRIILFTYSDSKFTQVAEIRIEGAVNNICEFKGNILAAISNSVQIFEWTSERTLRRECSYFERGHGALYINVKKDYLKTKGNFIFVGDPMTVLKYANVLPYTKEMECMKKTKYYLNEEYTMVTNTIPTNMPRYLRHVVRENNRNNRHTSLTSIEMLDDDLYLGTEDCCNLIIGENYRMSKAYYGDSRFCLGDKATVFSHGSLVTTGVPGSTVATRGSIFGTSHGSIGLVTSLTADIFNLLVDVQKNLSVTINSVGKIDHDFYRSICKPTIFLKSLGFIDGDLIESFLDLSEDDMKKVASGIMVNDKYGREIEVTVDDILKLIEELKEIH